MSTNYITPDDHREIMFAFETIKMDLVVGLDMVYETQAAADRKRAWAVITLARFGLVADDAWRRKIEHRYEMSFELRDHRSFVRRHRAIFVNGKWVPRHNNKEDEYPF